MEREFVEEIVGDEMERRKDLKLMSHLPNQRVHKFQEDHNEELYPNGIFRMAEVSEVT